MTFTVLVTGSREWRWNMILISRLHTLVRQRADDRPVTLRHGDARGADKRAARWAQIRGWEIDPHPVSPLTWRALGKKAGHMRNRYMVNLGADLCLAFIRDHSPGATGCASLAEEAGIETISFFDCVCHMLDGKERTS